MGKIKKLIVIIKEEGLVVALEKSFVFFKNRLKHEKPETPDVWKFVRELDINKKISLEEPKFIKDEGSLVLNWIIPDFYIGAGGHMTIFRTIHYLEKFGHTCRIYIINGSQFGTAMNVKKIINEKFINIKADVFIGTNNMGDSDAVIATSWDTAYFVYPIKNTRQKFYFVQDFEPMFFPMGSAYVFAENTYKFGFKFITAGKWLAQVMNQYGDVAGYFNLAYDKKIYKLPKKFKRETEIIYYARKFTPRRGYELAMEAFKIFHEKHPEVKIGLFGDNDLCDFLPFEYKNYGVLSHKELAHLYSNVIAGLSISLTNYSLMPQEMMACGMPVLEIKGENTTTIFGEDPNFIHLSNPNPYSIADGLSKIVQDQKYRMQLSERGLEYVEKLDWEKSARMIEEAVLKGFK